MNISDIKILTPANRNSRNLLFITALCSMFFFFPGCAKSPSTTNQTAATASPATAAVRTSGDVVKVESTSMSIAAGSSAEATVRISITPQYHVNANPASFPYLIATEVTPQKTDGLTAAKPIYPPAKKEKFQFNDQPLAVYEGKTQIKLPLKAAANATRGIRPLPLSVRVQACDSEKCYPPATLNSYISVEVK